MMPISRARELLLKLYIRQLGDAGDDIMVFLLGDDPEEWALARDALNAMAHFAEAQNINRMLPKDLME